MPESMTPAEKLARIRYEELGFKEPYEDNEPEIRADEERIARRQIRALAEMEPTEKQLQHWYPEHPDFVLAWKETSDAILAAASEGEQE